MKIQEPNLQMADEHEFGTDSPGWDVPNAAALETIRKNRFHLVSLIVCLALAVGFLFACRETASWQKFLAEFWYTFVLIVSILICACLLPRAMFISREVIVLERWWMLPLRILIALPIPCVCLILAALVDIIEKHYSPEIRIVGSLCMVLLVFLFLCQAGLLCLAYRTGMRMPYHHVRIWTEKNDIMRLIGNKSWEFALDDGTTISSRNTERSLFFIGVD